MIVFKFSLHCCRPFYGSCPYETASSPVFESSHAGRFGIVLSVKYFRKRRMRFRPASGVRNTGPSLENHFSTLASLRANAYASIDSYGTASTQRGFRRDPVSE